MNLHAEIFISSVNRTKSKCSKEEKQEISRVLTAQRTKNTILSSGGSRKFESGVHHDQLNRHGFTTLISYNVRLLTSVRVLLLVDIEYDYTRSCSLPCARYLVNNWTWNNGVTGTSLSCLHYE